MNSELLTIGEIADRLEEPPARVAYVVSKYRMKPIDRVGIIRLFDAQQVEAIRVGLYGLRSISARLGKPARKPT